MFKSSAFGAIGFAAILAAAAPSPAFAEVQARIAVHVGPPVPRSEYRPAPHRGMVWTPGYWDRRGAHHVWVPGQWSRTRPGQRWVEPQWVAQGGRWVLIAGHWAGAPRAWRRDFDRDGIPNRFDRDRDNDGIPNRYDRDRDGDGVLDRRDRQPDNPWRY